jgi:hypothetical protein
MQIPNLHRSNMSYPPTGTEDGEWNDLQGNYDPLGNYNPIGYTPLSGRFTEPDVSASLIDSAPPRDTHLRQAYQQGAATNPPAIPPRPPSQTGAVRNIGVRRMVPSTSPYRTHQPQTEGHDLLPNEELLGVALDRSNMAVRRPSHSSRSSSTGHTSVTQSSESLEAIQTSLQAIQSTFHITDDLLQRAQPLLQVSHPQHPLANF